MVDRLKSIVTNLCWAESCRWCRTGGCQARRHNQLCSTWPVAHRPGCNVHKPDADHNKDRPKYSSWKRCRKLWLHRICVACCSSADSIQTGHYHAKVPTIPASCWNQQVKAEGNLLPLRLSRSVRQLTAEYLLHGHLTFSKNWTSSKGWKFVDKTSTMLKQCSTCRRNRLTCSLWDVLTCYGCRQAVTVPMNRSHYEHVSSVVSAPVL